MNFYLNPRNGEWHTDRAKAKKAALGHPITQVDVPTTKGPLLDFLNEHKVGLQGQQNAETSKDPAPAPAPAAPEISSIGEAEQVTDFILERAEPYQIEQIFSQLGARYHEMRQACRP